MKEVRNIISVLNFSVLPVFIQVCKTMLLMLSTLTETVGEEELRNLVRNHTERKEELNVLEKEVESVQTNLQRFEVRLVELVVLAARGEIRHTILRQLPNFLEIQRAHRRARSCCFDKST